jgi:hypothetical protein
MPFSSKSWEAPLSGKRLLTLWNAWHGVEKRSKVGERSGVRWTRRWRKTDSNSRSLREWKGYGEPLQASIAVSGLNL